MISASKTITLKYKLRSSSQKEGASATYGQDEANEREGRSIRKQVAARQKRKNCGKVQLMHSSKSNPILKTAVAQIEKEFGQGSIMPLGTDSTTSCSWNSKRKPLRRLSTWWKRISAWSNYRSLWSRVEWQNHTRSSRCGSSSEPTAGSPPLSMLNMRSIQAGQRNLA